MKYTVVWPAEVEQKLTQMWLAGRDRQAISEATDRIEQVLGSDPINVGESRAGNFRILVEDPLAVIYSVSPKDCLVNVVEVSRTRMRREQ